MLLLFRFHVKLDVVPLLNPPTYSTHVLCGMIVWPVKTESSRPFYWPPYKRRNERWARLLSYPDEEKELAICVVGSNRRTEREKERIRKRDKDRILEISRDDDNDDCIKSSIPVCRTRTLQHFLVFYGWGDCVLYTLISNHHTIHSCV